MSGWKSPWRSGLFKQPSLFQRQWHIHAGQELVQVCTSNASCRYMTSNITLALSAATNFVSKPVITRSPRQTTARTFTTRKVAISICPPLTSPTNSLFVWERTKMSRVVILKYPLPALAQRIAVPSYTPMYVFLPRVT